MPKSKFEVLIFPLILFGWLAILALLTYKITSSLNDPHEMVIYIFISAIVSLIAGIVVGLVEQKYMAFTIFKTFFKKSLTKKTVTKPSKPGKKKGLGFKFFSQSIKDILIREAFKADTPINIEEVSSRISFRLSILPFILVAMLIVLYLYRMQLMYYGYSNLHIVLIILGVISIYFLPYEIIYLKLKQSQRASELERELPFVSVYLTMVAAVGLPLTNGLEYLRNSKIFKAFKKEVGFLKKITMFYGTEMLDSMEIAAKNHPSKNIADFYRSIVAIERSGGDRFTVLKEKSRVYFKILEERVNTLIEKFSLITNVEILVYVLLPLGLLVVSMIFAGNYGLGLTVMSSIFLPAIMTFVLMMAIKGMLVYEVFDTPPVEYGTYSLIAAIFYGIVIYVLETRVPGIITSRLPVPFYLFIAFSVLVIFLPAALYYYRWYRESDEFIYALPSIARHIAEESKKGFTPKQSMLKLSGLSFGKYTEKIIRSINSRLLLGYNIEEAIRGLRMPWLARAYFELLSFGEKIGVEPKSLDELAEFITNVVTIRKVLDDRSVGFKFSALIAIVALVFGFMVVRLTVFEQLISFASFLSMAQGVNVGLPINPISEELKPLVINITMAGIFINVFLMGVITGYATKGHPVAGLYMGIIFIVIAVFLIQLAPLIIGRMGLLVPS